MVEFIELDQGWRHMQKGIKKLIRILEGLPEAPFTSEEYMMLYTYPFFCALFTISLFVLRLYFVLEAFLCDSCIMFP